MTSEEIISALQELAGESELYQGLWDNLQALKQEDEDGYDAFIGDIVAAGVEDKDELEAYLMNP